MAPAPSKASAAVMSKRKILKPRGHRGTVEATNNSNPTSAFASFKSAAAPSSGFSVESATLRAATSVEKDDKNERIRALNEQFIASIREAEAPNTVANLTDVAKKYIEYYKGILDASPTSLAQTNATSLVQPGVQNSKQPTNISASKDESSESEDEEVKVQGPKFTFEAKPAKNLPFTFEAKPVTKKDDSDSESEIEIKGPVFTFNKPIKDNVFKIQPPKESANTVQDPLSAENIPAAEPKKAFNFSFGTTSAEKSVPAAPKPAFSFGSSLTAIASSSEGKPAISLGSGVSTNAEAKEKPALSFGSSTTTKSSAEVTEKPAFSFAPSSTTKTTSEATEKPVFSFGSSLNSQPKSKAAEKPAFSFGSNLNIKPTTQDQPAFSFLTTTPSNSASVFGGNAESSTVGQTTNSIFSSNQGPSSKNDVAKGTENIGKPAFTFGSSATAASNSFASNVSTALPSFGNNKETSMSNDKTSTPPFNFGVTSASGDNTKNDSGSAGLAPIFSFSAPNGSSNTSKESTNLFSFGSKTESPNAFSFGTSSETSKPFTFGTQASSTPAFSFGAKAPTNGVSQDATTDKKEGDDPEEEVTGGDFKPVAQLSKTEVNVATGEEGESVVFAKRAKLMSFDPSNKEQPYTNKGLGEVRILKDDSGKARILMRSEGSSRILLNTLISKSMTYSLIGNGSMVRVPIINNETKLPETYVIKLKLASDGETFLKYLNDLKQ